MSPDALQVLGTYEDGSETAHPEGNAPAIPGKRPAVSAPARSASRRFRSAVSLLAGLLVAGAALAGCEGPPARSKPWRHAPDAGPGNLPSTIPPELLGEGERLRALE